MPHFENNPKLGYYVVGDKIFYNKPQALVQSSQCGSFPEWNFNRAVFDHYHWSVEPATDILTLYKLRAQQLRDRYDYIRLEFSGGADSTSAMYAFVNNGIHLDEIVFRYPKLGEKGVSEDPFNTKPENTLSEYRYAARPLLDWVSVHSPRTKITFHDYTENLLTSRHDESWVYLTRDYFQPGHIFKHVLAGTDQHRRLLDGGKKLCVLYGIDKPKVCIRDKKWYLYFMDIQASVANPDLEGYTNACNEYFYWTPDLPDILAKQAHMVKNWFGLAANRHLQHLVRWPNYSFAQRSAFEQIIKPLIYPEYDHTTFQTSKPTNSFYNEMDHWFYINFVDTYAYKVWQAGLNHLISVIDQKFFNYELGRPVGLVGFLSPFYYLGEADFVDPGHNLHFKF